MKTNYWLILGAMMATGALAQDDTNALPPIPAPVTSPAAETAPAAIDNPAPAAKPVKHKKRAVAVRKLNEPTVALVAGPAQVNAAHVNVRGQAGFRGEDITRLAKGDTVNVLEQINLNHHRPDEPAQWAKIALPENVHVWVSSRFIDDATKTVSVKRLNLRAGPGENYSVLGVIERGTPVNEIQTKGEWTQIDAPSNAYAFVAAMYLTQTTPAPAPEVAPTPAPVPTPAPTATAETQTQPVNPAPTAEAPQPTETAPAPVSQLPPPPRIVSHEGVVVYSANVQAPTQFELVDPATNQGIDFLYTSSGNLDLNRYVNMRVVVTGQEGMDERWKETPIIAIENIRVISANAVPEAIIKHNH